MIAAVACGSGAFVGISALLYRRQVRYLGKGEQLRVERYTELEVHNGPGKKFLAPMTYRSAQIVKAETLGNLAYVRVQDTVDGKERIERGPQLLFLGPYDAIVHRGEGLTLNSTEYVLVEDSLTGGRNITRGPCVWFPGPQESGTKGSALALSSTEYVLVTDKQTGEKRVECGPATWFPGPMETGTKGTGISLSSTEFVLVENKTTGEKSIQRGPCIWMPGPLQSGTKGAGVSLTSTEYIIVEDKQTGNKRMIKGPCVWFPEPYDDSSEIRGAVALQDDEYLRIKDMATGQRWIKRGKALVFLEPTWQIETTGCSNKGREAHGIRKAWVLKKYEYVRLQDTITGQVRMHRGEATIFPEPDEQPLDEAGKMAAIDLKVNEYVKILDQSTGEIHVAAGREQVFLGPHERVLDGGKQKAIEVDSEHAVLVRNKSTGELRLVTENQLFVPGPDERIEQVQSLIRLAEHEAMIIKDREGRFKYHFGSPDKCTPEQPPSFFLPPYAEVVRLCWSRGRRREKRDLYIDRFDCRAQYMSFEFACRTKDNVELILEGTFFWEVVDLALMVRTTGDTSGDICNHARSQFIKHVARVTLKEFMDDLNIISNKVYEEDKTFYSSRGVKVHSLEVTGYKCAEESTSQVLQQIIQETTNRMNRLSQQESENEVKLFKMQGQIEQERLNGELLTIQHDHSQKEAQVVGAAEAHRVSAFIKGLAADVPNLEDRVKMWQTLRKTDALAVVSKGGASLYFTPNDVNLSIDGGKPAMG